MGLPINGRQALAAARREVREKGDRCPQGHGLLLRHKA